MNLPSLIKHWGIAIQSSFLDASVPTAVINVASVSQRNPFRYPGGKTWLVPRIRQWLSNPLTKPQKFIEPFAGGAIVGLTVAFDQLADLVILVERDDQVAAVWETIINTPDGAEWLANQIATFKLTPEAAEAVVSSRTRIIKKKAFKTIIQN